MTPTQRSLTYCRFFPDAPSLNAGFSRTLLQRGALIAGMLAIIAGILGMHVMTGEHGSHGAHGSHGNGAAGVSQSAPVADVHVHDAGALAGSSGHSSGHSENSGSSAPSHADTAAFGTSSCAGTCHDMQESGAACIPLAKTGSLTVFPPHEGGIAFQPASAARPAAPYTYVPASPSPCELSISRT